MHILPDQFETVFSIFYSGSIFSEVMSGSIFDPDTNTGATTGRKRIADHASGSEYLNKVTMTGEVIPHSTFHLFRKRHSIGTNYRYSFHLCGHEIFDDSLVPNMFDIYALHSGAFVYPEVEAAAPWDAPPAFDTQPYKLVLGYPDLTASFIDGDPSRPISNNTWLYSYPFEQKYRSIKKPFEIPTLRVSTSYDELLSGQDDIYYVAFNDTNASDRPRLFLELINIGTASVGLPITDTVTRSYHTVTEVFGSTSFDGTKFNISSTGHSASLVQSYKHFFGIGNGFRNQVLFETLTNASGGNAVYFHGQGSVVRGWKFGLLNAFPTSNKVVFSRKRFGQVRDMFEQRYFTKFFDPIGINSDGTTGGKIGAMSAPIQISFISGSKAFITSSVSILSNSTDSGIYDFEYRAGKPFRDLT